VTAASFRAAARGGGEIEEEGQWGVLVACGKARGVANGGRDEACGPSASASARHRPCEPNGGAPPQREHPHGGALLGSAPPISSPTRENECGNGFRAPYLGRRVIVANEFALWVIRWRVYAAGTISFLTNFKYISSPLEIALDTFFSFFYMLLNFP
jgi:hypothetical protein